MSVHLSEDRGIVELVERHRILYEGPDIEGKLKAMIRDAPQSKLSEWDVHRILRTSKSVFFDTHVEMVSGHHTTTYLRSNSIARIPPIATLIARDMADWMHHRFALKPIVGLVAPSSDVQLVAQQIGDLLPRQLPLKIVLTTFDRETGKIGTDIAPAAIKPGERVAIMGANRRN